MNQLDQKRSNATSTATIQREQRVKVHGELLLKRSRQSFWEAGFWMDRIMGRMLQNERFKVQVLRFVDVLPTLVDDNKLTGHLCEYFSPPEFEASSGLRWLLSLSQMSPALTARLVRRALLLVSSRFLGGADSRAAMKTVHALRRSNLGFSLDILGEEVVSEVEALRYQSVYTRLIDELACELNRQPCNSLVDRVDGNAGPGLYLSLKLSSLFSQASSVSFEGSVEVICERLRPIFAHAMEQNVFVCIDMEQYQYKEIVQGVFKKLLMEDRFKHWSNVGIAIQAYLRDTTRDIADLVEWAKMRGSPITVRLVRGAYWDYETVIAKQNGWTVPVWTDKSETDLCYEECLECLLDNYPTVRTAVATHNVRSLAFAMALAEEKGLNWEQFEFQMLYGMASVLQKAIAGMGYCLRVYVPFGESIQGMAYLVRRLLENSSGQALLGLNTTYNATDAPLQLAPPKPFQSESLALARNPFETGFDSGKSQLSAFVNEPLRRFTGAQERDAIQSAIGRLRNDLGKRYPLRINGEEIETSDFIESVNPANPLEIIGRVSAADVKHVNRAVAGAKKAFAVWSNVPTSKRAALLIKTAELLRNRRDLFTALEILEAGKTWGEADANITEAIDFLEYYARQAIRLELPEFLNVPGENNLCSYSPLGVGVVIPPWNFPLAILTGMLSAALVTGNTVILKPSSQTPVIAAQFVNVLIEAGLPAGVVQFLPGPGSIVGQALVDHNDIQFVAFTGSEAVGTAIIESASKIQSHPQQIKRVIAEMGGKNAIIVDEDAEPDDAINGIVHSAFGYQGQKCSACSRLIVVGKPYPMLLKRLIEAAKSLQIGNPEDPAVNFGPVIEHAAMERINSIIKRGRQVAKLELSVKCSQQANGFFVGPTIFSEVPADSDLFRKEIFGPVLSVLHAENLDQAIQLANDSAYALTGGFYSRSPVHIARVKQKFAVGNLYINRGTTGAMVGRQPFGGFRMSGIGSKAGGRAYLTQFMNQLTVTENTLRRGFAPESDINEL